MAGALTFGIQAGRAGSAPGADLPEWETTEKLRYAPPTLVAPTVVPVPAGYKEVKLAEDEDAILELPRTATRTRKLMSRGGRHVRIIGGDMGKGDLQPMAFTGSLFLEGLKFDFAAGLPIVNGCPVDVDGKQEHDAIHVVGVASGTEAPPDVYVQNCHIAGTHGTNKGHAAGIPVKSVTYSQGTYTVVTSEAHGLQAGQRFICGPTTEARLSRTYKVTQVAGETEVKAAAAYRPKEAPAEGLSGTGGYLWAELPKNGLHADDYQCNDDTLQNVVHFYGVTMCPGYQGFIGGHTTRDRQARALKMTRVNLRANDVWPRNDRSMLLYLGDTDQSSRTTDPNVGRKDVFPVEFDRVYLRPRPEWGLLEMIYPGPGCTRAGVDMGAFSDDGGRTVRWRPALGIMGSVTLSESGRGEAGKDYADLAGPHAPGLNYVSPGYSSDAVTPLALKAITATPTEPAAHATDAPGSVVLRLDVEFTGAGHVIDLTLADDADGRFALNGRDLVRTAAKTLDAASYNVTVRAAQRGQSGNSLARTFAIAVR